ncbi:hypothetical protein Syun_011784 [Stephania yunnanensis]|uniref:Uncharacterized protein n=1 Tax=Stephania yunnanensis TaxID=152371 RepID=A0AAP0JYY5_9MAGN
MALRLTGILLQGGIPSTFSHIISAMRGHKMIFVFYLAYGIYWDVPLTIESLLVFNKSLLNSSPLLLQPLLASPIDWATANGQFHLVHEVLLLDPNLIIKLTSLRAHQAIPDQPIDEEQLYYDAVGECPKGRVYGLGSLAKRKRRYEDPGAVKSRKPMVRRSEFDAILQRFTQFEPFV